MDEIIAKKRISGFFAIFKNNNKKLDVLPPLLASKGSSVPLTFPISSSSPITDWCDSMYVGDLNISYFLKFTLKIDIFVQK